MRSYDEQSVEAVRARRTAARRAEDAAAMAAPPALAPSTAVHLQRLAGNAAVSRLVEGDDDNGRSPVLDVVGRGGGEPLDTSVRADMQTRLGHDFADVRVHRDAEAASSARSVQAHAYTVGNDIVFNDGQYDPGSAAGRETLAHELTHVVQQRSGPVDGADAGGGIRVSDPGDRFEQEAERAARGAAEPGGGQAPTQAAGSVDSVQREGPSADEEDKKDEGGATLQGVFAQRDEEVDGSTLDDH